MVARIAVCGPIMSRGFFREADAISLSLAMRQSEYQAYMPRIPDHLLDGTAFLYRSRQEAKKRLQLGGTAFLVGREMAGSEAIMGVRTYVPYLVSNKHVVFDASSCVATVNNRDGSSPSIWDIDQNDWYAHPTDDLAATCVAGFLDKAIHRVTFVPERGFLTKQSLSKSGIGVGDEVFMIGRFVNHQGLKVNRPSARFGSISMMIENIPVNGRFQESFSVEMRSRTGFSGSPVVVYRTLATSLTDNPEGYDNFWCLLGVNWGYIKDEHGENTWLNGVVPAWKITEILDQAPLQAIQAEHERKLHDNAGGGAAQSAAVTSDQNDDGSASEHEARFNRLLDAAAKPPKSSDET